MITCIREVRRARGLTLLEVAERCLPPTTAQTIGRLETGTRTVSMGWLARIATALDVAPADLVRLPDRSSLPVLADLDRSGAHPLVRREEALPPVPEPGMVAARVRESVGDYRVGDLLWCERLDPDRFGGALNRDVIVPRSAGRYVFGRLIGREGGRVLVLPLAAGARQTVVADPAWLAVVRRLVRDLG